MSCRIDIARGIASRVVEYFDAMNTELYDGGSDAVLVPSIIRVRFDEHENAVVEVHYDERQLPSEGSDTSV